MKFVIDRAKWRCGGDGPFRRGIGTTEMTNRYGFKCCLGQCGSQLGVPDYAMLSMFSPHGVAFLRSDARKRMSPVLVELTAGGPPKNSALSIAAMEINDDENISHDEREAKLRELFAYHGHEIEFVGECVIP
jgi:hypothetical protein